MKHLRRFGALLGALLLGVWLWPDASHHYRVYESLQQERPQAYRVEVRNAEYFSALVERRGWHPLPTSKTQPSKAWDGVLDALNWPKSIQSVERFYTTDTSQIGLLQWMLMPDSSRLPTLQSMTFRDFSGGVIYRDPSGRYLTEEKVGRRFLIHEMEGGIVEWFLVDDEVFSRMEARTRNQPGQSLAPAPVPQ